MLCGVTRPSHRPGGKMSQTCGVIMCWQQQEASRTQQELDAVSLLTNHPWCLDLHHNWYFDMHQMWTLGWRSEWHLLEHLEELFQLCKSKRLSETSKHLVQLLSTFCTVTQRTTCSHASLIRYWHTGHPLASRVKCTWWEAVPNRSFPEHVNAKRGGGLRVEWRLAHMTFTQETTGFCVTNHFLNRIK